MYQYDQERYSEVQQDQSTDGSLRIQVKWKLLNLAKLAKQNPQKLEEEAAKVEQIFKTTS